MTRRSDNGPPPPPYRSIERAQMAKPSKNVILFGETGAGKSAVINLIADTEVAPVSPDMTACTLQATKHTLPLEGEGDKGFMFLNIWDTIGLEDPQESPLKAIENAHSLITDLHDAGGVDLLLFCIRGGRVTVAMQRHYRLFLEFLCEKRVPLAIVVTHLENEQVMENWWGRNQQTLAKYGMDSVAHACITAAPTHLRMYAAKRARSQTVLKNMLREALSVDRPPYKPNIMDWLKSLLEMIVAFFTGGGGSLKKKTLIQKLEARCGFSPGDAQKLANMILKRGK